MQDYVPAGDGNDTLPETRDSGKPLSDSGKKSMQGQRVDDSPLLDTPPGHSPAGAYGEIGDARRAETGPEKTEVKEHRPTKEDMEGSLRPPKGYRPGGIERGG